MRNKQQKKCKFQQHCSIHVRCNVNVKQLRRVVRRLCAYVWKRAVDAAMQKDSEQDRRQVKRRRKTRQEKEKSRTWRLNLSGCTQKKPGLFCIKNLNCTFIIVYHKSYISILAVLYSKKRYPFYCIIISSSRESYFRQLGFTKVGLFARCVSRVNFSSLPPSSLYCCH